MPVVRRLPEGTKNAARELPKCCYSEHQVPQHVAEMLHYNKLKPGRTTLESQLKLFEHMVEEIFVTKKDCRPLGGAEHYAGAVHSLLKHSEFRKFLMDVLRERQRRGTTTIRSVYEWRAGLIRSMVSFSGSPKPEIFETKMREILADKRKRNALLEQLAEEVSTFSADFRFLETIKELAEVMKEKKMRNPVVIDYGTGEGDYTHLLQTSLESKGIKPNIVATDKKLLGKTKESMRGSKIALSEHDLRDSGFLNRHGKGRKVKADVVRLGFVLQHTLKEHTSEIIQNLMKDVRVGGLIVIDGTTSAIYEKVDSQHIRRLKTIDN